MLAVESNNFEAAVTEFASIATRAAAVRAKDFEYRSLEHSNSLEATLEVVEFSLLQLREEKASELKLFKVEARCLVELLGDSQL